MPPSDVERVKELWRELTGAPSAFASSDPLFITSDDHRLSPPGWIGIVEICGRAVVATARLALDAAVGAGLLPQWRAANRNEASIALAWHLGPQLLGHQYSIRPN
jgi:hypothetical protein